MNSAVTVIDLSPAHLADALDRLCAATLDSDREVAVILRAARESLRAISWNRYASRITRESRASVMRRRHQGHQEGLNRA